MTDEVSMTAQIAQVGPKGGWTYVSNPSANPAGAGQITIYTQREWNIQCILWVVHFASNEIFHEYIRCILHVLWYFNVFSG